MTREQIGESVQQIGASTAVIERKRERWGSAFRFPHRGPRGWSIMRASLAICRVVMPVWLAASAALGASWEQAVGLYGGDVRALEIAPSDPDSLLAGTTSGRIFASTDGGESWEPTSEALPFPGWVVEDLLYDPEEPSRVWAALRGLHGAEGFVAMSEDHGTTWSDRSSGLPRRQVYALALAPGTSRILYAATRLGVFGSRDLGVTWRHLTANHPEIQKVSSLLIDPRRPERVFAGTWRRVYRSDDGGESWRGVFDGMVLDSEVFSLHAEPGGETDIWASTCGWVYKGSQVREAWVRVERGLDERRTPSFQVLPSGAKLAGTVAGVYRSEDEGVSWYRVTTDDLVASTLTHHPKRPERVFLGTEGSGVWRSVDGGRSFEPSSRGITDLRIAGLLRVGDEVIAAVRHAGPLSGLYSSFDEGRSYWLGPVKLPTVADMATDGRRVYAATERGLFERGDDSWQRIEELGDRVVHQVVSNGERVVVRSGDRLFERAGESERLRPIDFSAGRPSSIALSSLDFWVSSREGGLFRIQDNEPWAVSTPVPQGRIRAVLGGLLVEGGGQVWIRSDPTAPWQELGRRTRALSTGDPAYPLLLVFDRGPALLVGSRGLPERQVELTFPARDLVAALVLGERLVVGTAGHGILLTALGRLAEATLGSVDVGRAK
jgi:photosystem II stability/assembly factor-like uncharacterized protein